MNRAWSWGAVSFADSSRALFERLGAVDFARAAEADPQLRSSELASGLEKLGFYELAVCENGDDLEVAAAAVQAAGAVALPWPLGPQLSVPSQVKGEIGGFYLAADPIVRVEHADLLGSAAVFDLRGGQVQRLSCDAQGITRMPLDPFGIACTARDDITDAASAEVWRHAADVNIVLTAFYVTGALEKTLAMVGEYATQREQFGQRIGDFGAIQTRLADIVVAFRGLTELARYTLCKVAEETASPADTMALRVTMIDCADVILTNAHQVFGAVGLAAEHDLTVIDRHLQPLLRRPAGFTVSSVLLRDAIRAHGFDGIFAISPQEVAPATARPSRRDGHSDHLVVRPDGL
jgi:hypothetical protein